MIENIKEILLSGSYMTEQEFDQAQSIAQSQNRPVVNYLIERGLIAADIYGQAVAEYFKIPYADLNSNFPSEEKIKKIPEQLYEKYRIVLFEEFLQEIILASDVIYEQTDADKIKLELADIFDTKKITFAYSLTEDIEKIATFYQKKLDIRFSQIIEKNEKLAPEFISEIFHDAFVYQASDIHFEPQEKYVLIRYRIDGVLHEVGKIAIKYYENIVNRIKVLAHLRIDEHFAAQDGAIRYAKDEVSYDMRVSIVPTLDGEKIVIRVLTGYVKNFGFSDLGLSEKGKAILERAYKKPFGMILVTGPTGSGKSTSLYSILKLLNNSEVNITTIEDPVEYKIVGVNQIQVNTQTNLTFASGLKSIVRQDPDIILVGEIRDQETTEISVNAALTGHLVLSTFHANDAATAIPRLFDMGIQSFLLASTLEVVVAQRLLRKVCEQCKTSYEEESETLFLKYPQLKNYLTEKQITLYRGKGCNACGQTGFHGRTGIFEIIEITPEMKDLILNKPSAQQIWQLAKNQGSINLFEDGLGKIKNGYTTLDELYRVAPPPNYR